MSIWRILKPVVAIAGGLLLAILVGHLLMLLVPSLADLAWLIPFLLIAACILILVLEVPRARKRRHLFAAQRQPMSNEEFFKELGLPSGAQGFAIAARGAFGDVIGLSPEAIRPSDRVVDLSLLTYDGFDFLPVVFRIERKLGVRIDWKISERDARSAGTSLETVGNCIGLLALRNKCIWRKQAADGDLCENVVL
ncbi:MAG: hypothetical protein JXL80_01665 [Planctomycetes bacterium]|nr:hypothetical protein [Planctomycetota bacterium]